MLLIATFSPWVYVTLTQDIIGEAFVLRGTDGPGIVTICMGVLALVSGFFPRRRLAIAHALIAGADRPRRRMAGVEHPQRLRRHRVGSFLPGMGLVLSA
ncbi:hypothetical protein [Nesterenkonia pannonica]|uniref:hypothetical protein n=1 Tax=Nesterenkonia pannonica TaxID=1548602 RepID=UPI00216473FE|nr:hypothetical protein [Nesterenkonia pannonica]